MAKNYDYDTKDAAAEIARDVYVDTGPTMEELTALIERKLDAMVQDGKLRIFQKRHHVTA
jgi:hypothetical protein